MQKKAKMVQQGRKKQKWYNGADKDSCKQKQLGYPSKENFLWKGAHFKPKKGNVKLE